MSKRTINERGRKKKHYEEQIRRWKLKHECARWRWEFMRRNRDYKKDYEKTLELRRRVGYSPDYRDEHGTYPYYATPEHEEEERICVKWGIYFPHLPNPDTPYDKTPGGMSDGPIIDTFPWPFEQGAVTIVYAIPPMIRDKEARHPPLTEGEDLVIHINLRKVNSLSALKEEISVQLDEYIHYTLPRKEKSRVEKLKRSYLIDYDVILMVGDMKKEDLKHREIAKVLFPRDFDSNNEKANEESAIRKVGQYHKRYEELVNGDYKSITYP